MSTTAKGSLPVIILLYLFNGFSVNAQKMGFEPFPENLDSVYFNRPTINLSFGLLPNGPPFYMEHYNIAFNYEKFNKRTLDNRKFRGFKTGLGFCSTDAFAFGGNYIWAYGSGLYMRGNGNNHFQWSIGGGIFVSTGEYDLYFIYGYPGVEAPVLPFPVFDLGYRYQKPSGKFVFQVNSGFPQIISCGFGLTL
jgi:hypothetical protein